MLFGGCICRRRSVLHGERWKREARCLSIKSERLESSSVASPAYLKESLVEKEKYSRDVGGVKFNIQCLNWFAACQAWLVK